MPTDDARPVVKSEEHSTPSVVDDPDILRRTLRLRDITRLAGAREFAKRRDGMIHAMDGGLWLHRHIWKGRPMVHLVSTNRERLLDYGRAVGIAESRLQYKPLKDPRTALGGPVLPPFDDELKTD
jgi:hypothetical protein